VPELPEVEVVRTGLQRWVSGRTIRRVDVLHPRAIRRHAGGPGDFAARLTGASIPYVSRRGKYLWFPLASAGHQGLTEEALMGHLGMSGQLLIVSASAPPHRHLRVRMAFEETDQELHFVDQRTFGGLHITALVDDGAGGLLPDAAAHIARDPLDPLFDEAEVIRRIRLRDVEIKRLLLDQTLASGIGNIYADEALWRARLHGRRLGSSPRRADVAVLLQAVREVMSEALAQGGTSFDELYVNVNGESGYFDRSLEAYGQAGLPCSRCGALIRREAFMNRSSFWCPSCQRAPRRRPSVRG
jgi:formamidopyrimidine-DNA glycosylase